VSQFAETRTGHGADKAQTNDAYLQNSLTS
jgi:hypothetical protein